MTNSPYKRLRISDWNENQNYFLHQRDSLKYEETEKETEKIYPAKETKMLLLLY